MFYIFKKYLQMKVNCHTFAAQTHYNTINTNITNNTIIITLYPTIHASSQTKNSHINLIKIYI